MGALFINDADIGSMKGKVAVVTGGSSGIGKAIADLLIRRNANVFVCDLNPPETAFGAIVIFKTVHITDWSQLCGFMDEPIHRHGRLDYVFAGIVSPDPIATDTYDDTGKLAEPRYPALQVNLLAMMNTVKLGIHHMRKQEYRGTIICTSSKAGYSLLGNAEYSASKHGIIGMMRAIRDEMPRLKYSYQCIAPGFTDTSMVSSASELRSLGVIVQTPLSVALAALFLATQPNYHGKCIQVVNNKFREIEGEYIAMNEQIFGDKDEGRSVPRDQLARFMK